MNGHTVNIQSSLYHPAYLTCCSLCKAPFVIVYNPPIIRRIPIGERAQQGCTRHPEFPTLHHTQPPRGALMNTATGVWGADPRTP